MFLFIDIMMVEKEGKKFELCARLFEHAAHIGSNYLNGRCMVNVQLPFSVLSGGSMRYLSIPLGYRVLDKKTDEVGNCR